MPPRTLRIRQALLGFASFLVLVVIAVPSAFSLGSAGAAGSVGATGNDPRAFPRTYHIWGGSPNNYTHYDFVIGYPDWDLASLRTANPGATYLATVMLDPFNADWRLRKGVGVTNGAEDTFSGTTDTVVDGSASNLGTVPAWNGYWDTLHHPDGSIALINADYGHPGWNLTRTDTAEKVAEITAYGAKLSKVYRNGWDGIWSDNWIYRIGASWFYGSNLDTNRDGQQDDMNTVSRQWWDGLSLVGQRLRSYLPGKIVGGNGAYNIGGLVSGSDPSAPYKSSDVAMNEVLQFSTNSPDTVVSDVQGYLGFTDPYGMPRYFLLMHKLPGGQGDYRSMRWGFSLATISGGYYEPYAVDHSDAFKYDEFTGGSTIGKRGWLGQPVSAPTKLSNGVWRRDFQNGLVLNNSTGAAQTISLGATYHRLKGTQDATVNNGAAVTSVTVPAGDGLFLEGAGSSSVALPQNTAPPVVSGEPVIGHVLSASTGTWSGSPTSYAYQWQHCDATGGSCVDIAGARSSGYSLTELDSGWRMRVKVTATNGSGSASAVSVPTEMVGDPFSVTQSIVDNATLSSAVAWSATPVGKTVSKVDFSVDGKVVATDSSSPYSMTLQTPSLTNGSHVFAVQATATDSTLATASANATVDNGSNATLFTVTQNLVDGQTVSGTLAWSASVSGKTAANVEFLVNGTVVATDSSAPYEVALDTTKFTNGTYPFAVNAIASDSTRASTSASVAISNGSSAPSVSLSQNLTDGQTVSGVLDWRAEASGNVKRVVMSVDGSKVATEPHPPYQTSYETRKLADGSHTFTATAYTGGNVVASVSAVMNVANNVQSSSAPSTSTSTSTSTSSTSTSTSTSSTSSTSTSTSTEEPKLTLTSSIDDGSKISGSVRWTIVATGKAVSRVDFYIDDELAWIERSAPWVYGGDDQLLDTRTLKRGAHKLMVKAYADDGTVTVLKLRVVVTG